MVLASDASAEYEGHPLYLYQISEKPRSDCVKKTKSTRKAERDFTLAELDAGVRVRPESCDGSYIG
jgi:hypothetical protein